MLSFMFFNILSRYLATITHKISETDSGFHVKIHYRKSLITVFLEIFASINKMLILAGRLGTKLSFYGV